MKINNKKSISNNYEDLISDHYANCEPVAVIGLACRFPEADDSVRFWHNLLEGRDCGREFTRQELLSAGMDPTVIDDPNFVSKSSIITDADRFDAEMFGYSRHEAETMDPQQRLFLQTAWHALEHAGYAPRDVPHKTGVFASARVSTYPGQKKLEIARVAHVRNMQSLMGNDKDYVATCVAYKLNLKGPALSVQTACSSSLVAVHLACESLRSGECDMAIAGGVAVSFPLQAGYIHQTGMIFSPDGKCRPFDAKAEGTFAGNGVGVVTLRRLSDALRDGDPVIAVLRGSAINNDGAHKAGFTAPSVNGQKDVIEEALMLAGVESRQIGMVEAHGTATPLGDPIEVAALRAVFGKGEAQSCALSSVKGNLGHLDTASGIASLIKAVLAVSHGMIPPTPNFEKPNADLKLEETPFFVPRHALPWNAQCRLAGVSSFGIGGTNCHMIVSSVPSMLERSGISSQPVQKGMLLLSAATETSLRQLSGAYAEALCDNNVNLQDLVYTALKGRQLNLSCRLAVPVCDETGMALRNFAHGRQEPLIRTGQGAPQKQLWLFSGQGVHWPEMGREMYEISAAFAECLDYCSDICDTWLKQSLRHAMFDTDIDALQSMALSQPAIVAYELAMAAHWKALGLKPDLVLGHSLGEYAAAVVAGHYDIRQIMLLVCRRGALMQQVAAEGAMLAVFSEEEVLRPIAENLGVTIAAFNGPRHLVFSGPCKAISEFAVELDKLEIRHSHLSIAGAAHSALLDPILDAFTDVAGQLYAEESHIPLVSTLTGALVTAEELNRPDYWRRHMREPVRYAQAFNHALTHGIGICLELGPDAPLTRDGERQCLPDITWIAGTRRGQSAWLSYQEALGALFASGVSLDWPAIVPVKGQRCHAPLYPFDTKRYWYEADTPEQFQLLPGQYDPMLETARNVARSAAVELDLLRLKKLNMCAERLHAITVDTVIRRCVGQRFEQGVTLAEILRGGHILPRYRQLVRRLLRACVEDGYYRQEGERFLPAKMIPETAREEILDELRTCCEGFDAIPETIDRASRQFYEMLCGDVEPVAVIFPESASSGVEVLYQDFSFGRYVNQIAAGAVAGMMQERHRHTRSGIFRILEVGGGTGGTTSCILEKLAGERNIQYDFTDVSAVFTRRAQSKFVKYNFVTYRELDLHKDVLAQGFDKAGYDLIVAANVIHATTHVRQTLTNLRQVLKPGGHLLMREITQPMRLFDFVFGPLVPPVLDEDERGGELFLSTQHWDTACRAAGFERLDWIPEDGSSTATMSEHILFASIPARPAQQAGSLIIENTPDAILGHILMEDGCYLADWRACAGQAEAWTEHLATAFKALAMRHGNGILPPLMNQLPVAPDWLSTIRMKWLAEPFSSGRPCLEALAPDGSWQSLVSFSEPCPSFEALAAPGTHYVWAWRSIMSEETDTDSQFVCLDARPEIIAALNQAGIVLAEEGGPLIVLLDLLHELSDVSMHLLEFLNKYKKNSLVVVTCAAWQVRDGDMVRPEQRAAWGGIRVAATEQDCPIIRGIDLPENGNWGDLAIGLRALSQQTPWVAVRDGKVQVPCLMQQKYFAPALPDQGMSSDGWHVVTGAFGGLGQLSVEWLLHRGARKVALLAPRVSDNWPVWQQSLFSQFPNCQIEWFPCDVSIDNQLVACLDTLDGKGGVVGAIHAAGRLEDMPVAVLDIEKLQPVLAVKADAARWLCKWLDAHDARYCLLYSSAAAAMGTPGQGAHALACAYLDGLAFQYSVPERRLKVISIAWGAWSQRGRAVRDNMLSRLAEGGMGSISDAEGIWHLEQAVMRSDSYRLAMKLIPGKLSASHASLLSASLFQEETAAVEACGTAQAPAPVADLFKGEVTDLGDVAAWLTHQIARQLRLDDLSRLSPCQPLLQIGLDSLQFLELSAEIRKQLGLSLDAGRAYNDLSIEGLSRLIVFHAQQGESSSDQSVLKPDPEHRYDPFPLTPIQHAYWIGRTALFNYGGIACQIVFEWDKNVAEFNLDRLECAFNAVIRRHDMLRMIVDPDGQQRILAEVPDIKIKRVNLAAMSADLQRRALEDMRKTLSSEVLPTDQWPLFDIIASELDTQRYRLHLKLDLLQFDVQSFKILMDDLACAYRGESLEPLTIHFRDYVLAEEANRKDPSWHKDSRYWQEILYQLPPAPRLPLATDHSVTLPRIVTYKGRLAREEWSLLKTRWQSRGITPSAGLLALFARVLERWSRQPDFTLNLTFFNRRPVHPDISKLIGDFTSVLLMDMRIDARESLAKTAETTQQRLWQHLAHSQINGVELMRDLSRGRGQTRQPLMPVVFTSLLGMALDGLNIDQAMSGLFGEPVHVSTQTPQVWLDHQVMESDGDLVWNWFCMDNVLAADTARRMLGQYEAVLRAVVSDPACFDKDLSGHPGVDETGVLGPRYPWLSADGTDMRQIEDIVLRDTAVRQAEVLHVSESVIDIALVAENSNVPNLTNAVLPDTETLPQLDGLELIEVDLCWQWLEKRAFNAIITTLNRHQLFSQAGNRHSFKEIMRRLSARSNYERLVRQWLALLLEDGWVRQEGDVFSCIRPLRSVPVSSDRPSDAAWLHSLDDYLQCCSTRHDALLSGQESPLALFFDEDKSAVAKSFYSDNPVIDCLHRSAAVIVRLLANQTGQLRILEVGAGTGATTRHLLPALGENVVLYNFTDVSAFFLDAAKASFGDYPQVHYGMLDINTQVDFKDHPDDGYDFLVAVNVLHDACHIRRSLERLSRLLKPGGYLLLIEATERSSILQMATVGFIETLNTFQDERVVDNKPLLDLPMWQKVLDEAGYALRFSWPTKVHTPMRQHLLLAQAVWNARPAIEAIEHQITGFTGCQKTIRFHWREILGREILGREILGCETLDVPDKEPALLAAKDTASEPESVQSMQADNGAEPPDSQLVRIVINLWSEVLSRPVDKESDFFLSGGDSLIATRMLARAHKLGLHNATIQNLFAHPKLEAFCRTLYKAELPKLEQPCLLFQGNSKEKVYLFHASDGELGAYRSLAQSLDRHVLGFKAGSVTHPASIGELAAQYERTLCKYQPDGSYLLVGWSYGAFLAAETAQRLSDRGKTVGVVLLDPVSRSDFFFRTQSELLRLMAQGRITLSLPDDLENMTSDEQIACFLEEAVRVNALPWHLSLGEARDWITKIGQLMQLLADYELPKSPDFPCLWIEATRRPASWHSGSTDWSHWFSHVEHTAVAASHWDLVMEDTCAKKIAALIQDWEQRSFNSRGGHNG